MRVLVTGGAGYIGSHTCKALAVAGFSPVVYDNLSTGHRAFVKWGALVEGDIKDTDRVREALRAHQCEAVLHFAASAYVGESVQNPRKYVHNNACGTAALLDAVLAAEVSLFVLSSTCAVYGHPNKVPISEDTPLAPVNPYGESKCYVEWMLKSYGVAYKLNWMALRYFNAAGVDAAGEVGERHDPEMRLLPIAVRASLTQTPLPVFGTDYPTPDGTAIRDYVHVSDLATAHVAALERLRGGAPSRVYNLGTGQGHSVLDVAASVEKVTGKPVTRKLLSRRVGDPPVLVADPARARTELGWEARASSIENIVETAVRWHEREIAT